MLRAGTILLILFLSILDNHDLAADDKLYLKNENGIGKYSLKGEVLSWSGDNLNFRLSTSGLLKTYPTQSIISVETYHSDTYSAGLKLLKNKQFLEAGNLLKEALQQESRIWFKQEILAQLVICYVNSNQLEYAVDTFIQLTNLDPQTRYLKLIPLPLLTENKQRIPVLKAKILLENGDNKYQHLLGSAYLIHDQEFSPLARKKLELLTFDGNAKVSFLARIQLWRLSMDDKTPEGVLDLWQTVLNQAPLELQTLGGIILGEAYAKVGRVDQAVEFWLRPWAENYPNQQLIDNLLQKSIELTQTQGRHHSTDKLRGILKP